MKSPASASRFKVHPSFRTVPGSLVILGLCCLPMLPLTAQDTPPPAEEETTLVEEDTTFSPQSYPIDRYQKLRGKSPFEFELAKPAVAPTADPFAELSLAGYAGSASRPTVYLVNGKSQERITVLPEGSGRKDESGFKVLSINRGKNLASTTVKLEKDGVQKELSFDPKMLSSMTGGASGGQPGAAPGARPGIPGQPGAIPGRPPVPGQAQAAATPYRAPAAFIPGGNRPAAQPAQQVNNGTIQLGQQPGAAVPAGGGDAQQQLNIMLNNGNPAAAAPVPGSQAGQPATQQPRRRVVLPTP